VDEERKSETLQNKAVTFFLEYWFLFYNIILFIYLELLYHVWSFSSVGFDFIFPVLFSLSAGGVLYLLISLVHAKARRIVSIVVILLISIVYGTQIVYYWIFQQPLSLISVGGAGDAFQFQDVIIRAILRNLPAIILCFVPLAVFIFVSRNRELTKDEPRATAFSLLFSVISFSFSVICVNLTGDDPVSPNTLYYGIPSPELSFNKLGVLTSMRLDFQRLVVNQIQRKKLELADGNGDTATEEPEETAENPVETTTPSQTPVGEKPTAEEPAVPKKLYNVMDIDFDKLIEEDEGNETLVAMHKYFRSVEPTATNEYTGMFKGCNLILITAESFSHYVIDPELTPTLYMMANEGFVFKNFYNPVWWVSTSDGEYVACTGLIPKSGVWSMAMSGSNYMPFAMGNQFRELGYITKAYHNHTYTYYKRNISHPNLGYDYKGVGNGLDVKKTWPESDLEMIEVTADEYIGDAPFHAYYMTVSGHMNYNFSGNQMAAKNRKYVEHLPYSDPVKAYLACNLELEFALEALLEKLEAAGVAEKTVIAISADHYPYGLEKKYIDEMAGHEVEKNFELYRSSFILWKKGMKPVVVEKPCASLDIIPTLSNLFGLEYDSRLLMGRDILSDSPTLVIFSNRSWITDKAMYNSSTNKVTFFEEEEYDKEYVKKINKIVADKFKYSAKILETDYYARVLKK